MRMWTDYPIRELGDIDGQDAPIRECELVSYDGDRYVTVHVFLPDSKHVLRTEFKSGYLYTEPKRLDYAAGSNPKRVPYEYLCKFEEQAKNV
jgi:hypothetical protein